MSQRSLRDYLSNLTADIETGTESVEDSSGTESARSPRSEGGESVEPSTSECSADCCKDTAYEPLQESDPSILHQTRKLQGKKWRQFSSEWFKTYPWLVLCTTRFKAFCSYCRYSNEKGLLTEKRGGDAFVVTGFDNWKKAHESFVQHAQSASHREAMLKRELMRQPSVQAQLNDGVKRDQKIHRDMLLKQLSSLRYLLRQGLAVRGHEEWEGNLIQLLLLRSEECTDLKQWLEAKKYLSHDIVNELMGLMANRVLREILREIRESSVFSLIADESSDVSHKEQLCITIRWVDKDLDIHEAPLELINVPKTDSSSLTMFIKDCLVRFSLPIIQCRGQAYDGASNMSGHIHGVAAQIQQDVPSALYVHCLAHCTNLSLQTVGKQLAPIRDALDLVMGLSHLIRISPKWSSLFQSVQLQLSPGAPSLKPLCPTRWTVRTVAIESVLTNYEVLCDVLGQMHELASSDCAIKARGFLGLMEKFSTFFGLKLSHLIFSATEQLSLSLQGKDTTIQEAVEASNLALRFLSRQRSDDSFESFYCRVVEASKDLTFEPTLPRYRKRPRRLDDGEPSHSFESPKTYFRQQCFEALDVVHGELKRRFQQERGMPVAAVLESLLLNAANGMLSDSSENPEELSLYAKDIDIQRFTIQLKMIPDLMKTYNEKNPIVAVRKVTNLRTLCEVMNNVSSSKSLFREVFKLLQILLTVPVTTATAERTFSTLRRLKTYLRSTMTQPRLNHAMLLHTHKGRTDNIDLVQIAQEFVAVNDRRRQFFGTY